MDEHAKQVAFTVGGYPPEEPEHFLGLKLSSAEQCDEIIAKLQSVKEQFSKGNVSSVKTFIAGTVVKTDSKRHADITHIPR
jgi:hypothetical protein